MLGESAQRIVEGSKPFAAITRTHRDHGPEQLNRDTGGLSLGEPL